MRAAPSRRWPWFVFVALVLGIVSGRWTAEQPGLLPGEATVPSDAVGPCQVKQVIDGDTIDVQCPGQKRERIRMLRIDTPEREEPGYAEARSALRSMLRGQDVHLVYERPGEPARGGHGRVLAYVYVGDTNVNVEIVRQGHSHFDTRWGEGRFARDFEGAERAQTVPR
ncbi:MAG: thermonuclease family protein [Myxococcota bacterium]